jgi:hypothetical protein
MGLFLHSFELSKKIYSSILDVIRLSFLRSCLRFFLNNMRKDGVIDWKAIDIVQLLDKFEAHGASDSAIPVLIDRYI